jgi:transposase
VERDEWLRTAWRVTLAAKLDPKRLVFVDEMGTNTSLSALRAWSRRGQRAFCSLPRNRGSNTTLLSSMTVEGMGPSLAVEGATDREVFETYVEKMLAPSLRSGQVVVMDNLSAHKGERVRALLEERGAELLYLPPYSPDLNPIEEAFAKIKNRLRKVEARTREALVEAMGQALSAVCQCSRRAGLFRALWILRCGSTVLMAAVGSGTWPCKTKRASGFSA